MTDKHIRLEAELADQKRRQILTRGNGKLEILFGVENVARDARMIVRMRGKTDGGKAVLGKQSGFENRARRRKRARDIRRVTAENKRGLGVGLTTQPPETIVKLCRRLQGPRATTCGTGRKPAFANCAARATSCSVLTPGTLATNTRVPRGNSSGTLESRGVVSTEQSRSKASLDMSRDASANGVDISICTGMAHTVNFRTHHANKNRAL